ncbi:hypothetical protein GOQ27_11110 [Clostridium sp. D2Q-11]|uniref:Uncharacterized protein n=1 Tax=Anaeromonas frigoriresistens TaxID=2683708 RepID=A0A942UTT5_9FIRM|nr:DUF6512 family protein [Anaeromonas frigoriresistens]MBS4539013.1 hypothetical protein [Anaeromonas frigoriresistens]
MSYRSVKNSIIKSIFILFIAGSILHFIYDLSGQNIIVGLFAPVNESVWEHNKLAVLPIILWWTIYYVRNKRKNRINKRKWFTGALVSVLVSIGTIPVLHYFFKGAFGVKSLVVDIIIFLLALLFGQLLGFYLYNHSRGLNPYISIGLIILIILIFIIFTLYPPHLPLFRDGPTGKYGIF